MSSKKDSGVPAKPPNGFSRRGFIGVGLGGGALGTTLLEKPAVAAPAPAGVVGPGPVPITLTINGKPVHLTVEPSVTLIEALRNRLDITGAKCSCDRGNCGTCTVLMDGKSVYSCNVLAIDAQGRQIETIEGMSVNNPISAAFVDHDGQQCGYCTSGFVIAVQGFLREHPNPTEEDVKHGLGGNFCRCGAYMGIRQAVLQAAKAPKGGKNG